jgi:hypothetical protein
LLSPRQDRHAQMTNVPPKLDNKYKETKAAELLAHHRNTTSGIIGMGRILTEVKKTLSHGEYTEWMRKHFRFSNATSLRYRRSFALATSIEDFANVKLETMALYFCAELHDELSKPIPDPNNRTAIDAGLKAVLARAREYLTDEGEARGVYSDARLAKLAKLTKATAAEAEITSADALSPSTSTAEPKETATTGESSAISGVADIVREVMLVLCTLDDEERQAFRLRLPQFCRHVPASLDFSAAVAIVMGEKSEDEWLTEIENVGEVAFLRYVDHMSALTAKLNVTNSVIKMKADRAEAKTKNKS